MQKRVLHLILTGILGISILSSCGTVPQTNTTSTPAKKQSSSLTTATDQTTTKAPAKTPEKAQPLVPSNPEAAIEIDASADIHDISPLIYGLAFADTQTIKDLNIPANRAGGNAQTTYNWKADSTNRAADWFYESLPNDNFDPAKLPDGNWADRFFEDNKSVNADTMMTIPMIGYVAKDRERRASFSVKKYGAQEKTDNYYPDAGNGNKPDGTPLTGNDPNDAYMKVDENFMAEWVKHLTTKYGSAANGGMKYYLLDNEPGIWFGTHRDIAPVGIHADELINRSVKYAKAIKDVDPSSLIVGYEDWSYQALLISPFDKYTAEKTKDWGNYPDKKKLGYDYFAVYYLQKMKEAEQKYGKRLLDVFSAHFYPQSGEFGNDESENMQATRMRSTRTLWDREYMNESWINDKVFMIPRMKEWVDKYYPGTKIALTEYNWGSLDFPDGGIAQADILGILGRESADIANLWTSVAPYTPGFNAFKIFRNYDGNNSTFGDKSIKCTVPNPDQVAAFASIDSKTGELKVIVLNKYANGNTPVTLKLNNFKSGGDTKVFQWAGVGQLSPAPDTKLEGDTLKMVVPPYSATLFVVKP